MRERPPLATSTVGSGLPTSGTLITYNRRIDGLRAIAVVLVVFHHWLSPAIWINWTPNGPLGVDLFFVLSGYLITGILLRFRRAVEAGAKSVWRALGDFYTRRALRLFPLYYAVLAAAAFWPQEASGVSIRSSWPWYVAFLQNYKMFADLRWDGFLSHFWTLGVEEQYYLLWGVAVLTLPRRVLLHVIGVGIVGALAVRTAGVVGSAGNVATMGFWSLLTPACFDGLGLGSLAALAQRGDGALARRMSLWSSRLAIPCVLFLATFRYAPAAWYACGRTTNAILALRLLYWAISPEPARLLGQVLESTPFVELGRRSYGLYVFHNLVPFLWQRFGIRLRGGAPLLPTWAEAAFLDEWQPIFWLALLILLAFGSWRFFEGPINRLKDRFAP